MSQPRPPALAFVLVFLLWMSACDVTTSNDDVITCSDPAVVAHSVVVVEDASNTNTTNFTTVQSSLGVGETLCYGFSSESGRSGSVQISLIAIRSVHAIASRYSFRVARAEAACQCDCPGGAFKCTPETDSCWGQAWPCASAYSSDAAASGCALAFLGLSASLCCAVTVRPAHHAPVLTAVKLAGPTVVATIRVAVRDSAAGREPQARIVDVDLSRGFSIDWLVGVSVGVSGPLPALPSSDWLVVDAAGRVLVGAPVNGLHEWDVRKLGWLKVRGHDHHVDPTATDQIRTQFAHVPKKCQQESYELSWLQLLSELQLSSSLRLESAFPWAGGVTVQRRRIEVTHVEAPALTLAVKHQHKVEVLLRSSSSRLSDFDGLLLLDSGSQQFLSVRLHQSRGTLRGTVQGANSTHVVHIVVVDTNNSSNSNDSYVERRVGLSGVTCLSNSSVLVTLAAHRQAAAIAKHLPCVEAHPATFTQLSVSAMGGSQLISAASSSSAGNDCLVCVDAWLHWLHPLNWFDAVWNVTRAVVVAIALVVGVAVVACCVKALCCAAKMANCCSSQ